MIPDDVIAEIRSRTDIVAVIGEHVQLRKAGRNWKGLCPFHGEKTPSFNVSPDKGFFYCFGCHKKGDVFTFVMEYGGRSFTEAAEQLAGRAGVVLPQIEESPELRRARGERAAMLALNRVATDFFREVLAHPQKGAPGRAYLDKRGVDAATRDRFQLGYAPADWRALADHLKAKRCDLELAIKLGLVAPQPRAGGYYDRFRERLVCPVMVPGGDVVGFSARLVEGASSTKSADRDPPPKYVNSPESLVYKKSKLLFGLAQARESMGARKRAVLVEGNFDVISLHQAGFTEVIAPLGTSLTAEQVDLLRRLTESVILLYDGDKAGYAATLHALQLFAAADVEVLVARPGDARTAGWGADTGQDPDSLIAGGPQRISEVLDRARDGFEFFATEVWSRARGSSGAMSRALDDAVMVLTKVANPTKRELIVGKLATALEVERGVILRALARAQKAGPARTTSDRESSPPPHAPAPTNPPPTDEVEVVALLADHPDLVTSGEADKAFSLLTDARLRDICSAARAGQSLVDLATSPESGLPTATATLVLSGKYAGETDARSRLAVMAGNLSRRTMAAGPGKKGAVMAELQARLTDAQRKGDRVLARQLASQIVSIRTAGMSSPGPREPKAG